MTMNYEKELSQLLPLLGHRNWILVVDKAYPLQSSPGIQYINSGEELLTALKTVLDLLANEPHVRPIVYLDKELSCMSDDLAQGSEKLKADLADLTKSCLVKQIPHDDVFAKLDAASKLFNVVVVKTESLIPYTSVFIELDCGYWPAENEKILRDRLRECK